VPLRPRKRLAPWADCTLWLLLGWLAIFSASILVLVIVRLLPGSAAYQSGLNFVPNLAGIALVLALGLAASPAPGKAVLSLRPPPWRVLPAVALSTFGLTLMSAQLDTWLQEVLPPPDWVNEIFRRVLEYHTPFEFLGVFAFLVVVAPVTEELLFRGLFLHRLREGYGPRRAVMGSAFCFGVFHLLPWQVVGAALVGVYLGWLVIRTRSIGVSIFAHGLFNLVPVAASGLASLHPLLQRLSGSGGPTVSYLPWPWLAGSAIAFGIGVLGIRRLAPPRWG
jgi:membrane protease YdiL (CAAX protease family)